MVPTITAVVMVVTLAAWHLKIRRHANWNLSPDARFYITSGYPLIAIAVYFLSSATSDTDWAWALGNLWALVAMVSFVYGFDALNVQQRSQHSGRRHSVLLVRARSTNNGTQSTHHDGQVAHH